MKTSIERWGGVVRPRMMGPSPVVARIVPTGADVGRFTLESATAKVVAPLL